MRGPSGGTGPRRALGVVVSVWLLASCSGEGSDATPPTTTTVPAKVLQAEVDQATDAACETAFKTGDEPTVKIRKAWRRVTTEAKALEAVKGCVAERETKLLSTMDAEVQRACGQAVGTGEPAVAKMDPDWPDRPGTADKLTAAAQKCAQIRYQDAYLELVKRSNCLGDEATDWQGGLQWSTVVNTVQPRLKAYVESEISFYEGLAAFKWPATAQPAVDQLIGDLTAEAAYWLAIAEATNVESFNARLNAVPPDTGNNTAGLVRAKLGLPNNLTDDVDWCAQE